jgi:small-conductance mechanosensitive channel
MTTVIKPKKNYNGALSGLVVPCSFLTALTLAWFFFTISIQWWLLVPAMLLSHYGTNKALTQNQTGVTLFWLLNGINYILLFVFLLSTFVNSSR